MGIKLDLTYKELSDLEGMLEMYNEFKPDYMYFSSFSSVMKKVRIAHNNERNDRM